MSDVLQVDQVLAGGQAIVSNNGRTRLVMQGDGNLVVYEAEPGAEVAVWASGTDGTPDTRVIMQGDGNLVVYAGHQPVWASNTDGNPGAVLVLQDDGNAVVYRPDGRALWASGTNRESRVLPFSPRVHGFQFPNVFVNNVATIPGFGAVQTRGRCGGMAYAALDHYLSGVPIPGYRGSDFAPGEVPPDGHWLAAYIYDRLMNSFAVLSAAKFADWTLKADHQTWFYKGVTRWTKEDEFPALRQRIDSGTPAILGLVNARNLGQIGNENHQVLAYGYEYHPVTRTMTVLVYDNNHPNQEWRLRSTQADGHFTDSSGKTWRGFFLQDYGHRHPPVLTTRPADPTSEVRYGDTVRLSHLWTGRTLHSHALNYGHPGGSGQQQVTCFQGADDNDLWRIKGPDGTPEEQRAAEPVRHGDVIRLQHVATGRNLHSHSGLTSPVTRQQEVTAFGNGGIGDGNDDWRVDLGGAGTWTAGQRLRLIHVPTGHALHSHPNASHPAWTAGQQEVTAYPHNDANDFWKLLEIATPEVPAFQSYALQTGTAQPESNGEVDYAVADTTGDGRPDLVAIHKRGTGTNTTELHVLSGASGFQSFALHTGTGLHEVDDSFRFAFADFDGDGRPDLFAIKQRNTGSGSTEVHVLSAASNYQAFALHTGTPLPETDDTYDFALADYDGDGRPDLFVIRRSGTASGRTEIEVLSGASNFQTSLLRAPTALHATDGSWAFAVANWDRDSVPDLVAIKKLATGTQSTEVHVLSGASSYQQFVLQTGTALHETDDSFAFAMRGWDADGRPDLFAIKKRGTGSNSTEVHVLKG